MPELQKLVVSAMHSGSLEPDADREVPLDRVMAFAVGAIRDPLGEQLFRLKYMNELSAYPDALRLLTSRSSRPGESRRSVRRVCERVLEEWFHDRCPVCAGRGHIVIEGTPHARNNCSACGGSGRQPISIQARCAHLGVSPDAYPRWEPRLTRAYAVLVRADEALWLEVSAQLGRAGGRRGPASRFAKMLAQGVALRGKGRILPGSRPQAHNDNTMPGPGAAQDPGAQP